YYLCLWFSSGHPSLVLVYVNVDLAPNTELALQINSRFDRETGSRNQNSRVLRFQIVDIGAVAVHFGVDVVTGAMNKVIRVARLLDHISTGIVYLPPVNRLAFCKGILYEIRSCVARVANYVEDFGHFFGNSLADKRRPGDVGIN